MKKYIILTATVIFLVAFAAAVSVAAAGGERISCDRRSFVDGTVVVEHDFYVERAAYAAPAAGESLDDYLREALQDLDSIQSDRYYYFITVSLAHFSIPAEEGYSTCFNFIFDNSDLFYLEAMLASRTSNGVVDTMNFYLSGDKEWILENKPAFDAALDECLTAVKPWMGDLDKAVLFHEYLSANAGYDYTFKKRTSFNALVERRVVCQGFALAYNMLSGMVGLDSRFVFTEDGDLSVGDSQNHAWSLVKVDGLWYYVDITHDDLSISKQDILGAVFHKHLLLSESGIRSSKLLGYEREFRVPDEIVSEDERYEGYFTYGGEEIRSALITREGRYYFAVAESEAVVLYRADRLDSLDSAVAVYTAPNVKNPKLDSSPVFRAGDKIGIASADAVYLYGTDGSTVRVKEYDASITNIIGAAYYDRKVQLTLSKKSDSKIYTESFSIDEYLLPVVSGDLDDSYSLDLLDLINLGRVCDGSIELYGSNDDIADVNGDGSNDADDIYAAAEIIVNG